MVDGMFVARGVSEVALSAVTIASPFVNFLFSVSILFAVGTSTAVAIFLGQGRQREANQANTQNMVVTGVLSLRQSRGSPCSRNAPVKHHDKEIVQHTVHKGA